MLKGVLKTFLCFVSLHILGSNGVARQPDVFVRLNGGGTARLECRFSSTYDPIASVLWRKDGREKIVNVTGCTGDAITTCQVSRSSPGKYAVEGSLTVGVTLVIGNLAFEDDGMYDCKAVLREGLIEKSFRLAVTYVPNEIAIFDLVKDVEVSNMTTLYAVVDRPYVLNCTVSPPCKPPAIMSWSYDGMTALVAEQANHRSAQDSPLVTSSKSVELTANEDNTRKKISCIAMHYGLAAPLEMNVILEVGRLPESPSIAENPISSVTVNSFTVTWSPRSSGGEAQTFTVTYCEVVRPEECSEISGIGQTITKIENLRPFTLYRVTVKSHTVYGFSEDNGFIEKSTIPLSPQELGVEGVYKSQFNRADIVRVNNNSGPLPDGLCFQLVDQGFQPSTDAAEAAGQDCVNVGQYLVMSLGQYWTKMALVAFGNSVYSASSKTTGIETVPTPSSSPTTSSSPASTSAGFSSGSKAITVGSSGGAILVIVIVIISIFIFYKRRSDESATIKSKGKESDSSPQYENPAFDQSQADVHTYQELNTDSQSFVNPTNHHTYQDLKKPDQEANYQDLNTDSQRYANLTDPHTYQALKKPGQEANYQDPNTDSQRYANLSDHHTYQDLKKLDQEANYEEMNDDMKRDYVNVPGIQTVL